MTNSRSMDVINDARDMELQLNWILFKQEQEKVLWGDGPLPLTWRPGDPLYKKPKIISIFSVLQGGWLPHIVNGNWIRPMMEGYDEDFDDYWHDEFGGNIEEVFDGWTPICGDCETSWNVWGLGYDCWSCGKDYSPPKREVKKISGTPVLRDQSEVYYHITTRGMRGARPMYSIMDEGTPHEQVRNEDGEWVPTGRISEEGFSVDESWEGPISFRDLSNPPVMHFNVETFELPIVPMRAWMDSVGRAARNAEVPVHMAAQTMAEMIEAFTRTSVRRYLMGPRRAGRSTLMDRLRSGTLNEQSSRPRERSARRRYEREWDERPRTNRRYPGSEPITEQRRRRNL